MKQTWLSIFAMAAMACVPTDLDTDEPTAGTVVVNGATWSCTTSANPLPGWRNCTGTVRLTITKRVPSGIVSAFYNFPDAGSFFHGQLSVGSGIPGTVTVNVTNEYVSRCVTPYSTTITVYDGPQSAQTAPVLATTNLTLTGC